MFHSGFHVLLSSCQFFSQISVCVFVFSCRLIRSELPPNINGVHSGLDKIIGYFILEAIDRAHSTDARPR